MIAGTLNINDLRQWVKRREHPMADLAYRCWRTVGAVEFPLVRPVHATIYRLHRLAVGGFGNLVRILYWTPLFKSQLRAPAPRLYLYGGIPLLAGPLTIRLGSDCRVSGHSTITGRTCAAEMPALTVGNNVDIGWQTTIAVGRRVELGHNVRIAGRALLAGYPGHPLDPADRADGLPDRDDQAGDIILEDDVWLATGVTVTSGVRIGKGTIVSSGSVVTKDLPAGVLAGGVPARIIKRIQGGCS